MGIKNFSKIFEGKEIKMKNLKNTNIIVDASVIAYQSSLCMKNINALTDADGNPTIHINVLIAKCLNFHQYASCQSWVFDYHEKGYVNPSKTHELNKRKKIKDKAVKKITELNKKNAELFSSDEDVSDEEFNNEPSENKSETQDQIYLQEKICFSVNDTIINDMKFILNCFDIPWCVAPKSYEAEAICAFLTESESKNNGLGSAVWTTDTDAIIYGADQIIRELKIKKKKTLMLYELDILMEDKGIDMIDLRKIAVISGSDHAPKTPGIGAKTVLKKFKSIELTPLQKDAVKVFETTYDVSKLKWNNSDNLCDKTPFDNDKITQLLDWLESKKFNRERIQKQINKVNCS
jgi:5'-3' exonuclease